MAIRWVAANLCHTSIEINSTFRCQMYHLPERLGAMNQISTGLIWDDDRDFLFITQYIFRERGYTLEHHQTFDTARAQWQSQAPTVAIIKRSLHTANDGLVFCSALRADIQLKRLPIIIGWADMIGQTFEEAFAVGANGCFGRVFNIDGVLTMIELLAQDATQSGLVDQVVSRRI
jgi:ActR/RegA family two-component response regulator